MKYYIYFPAEIQKLKHCVPKGDKKKKREVAALIAQKEAELEERQNRELQHIQQVCLKQTCGS